MKNTNRIPLQRLFLLTGLIFLGQFLMACNEKETTEKYIGIQLWSVRNAMNENPENTLQALGEMGYAFVEAAGYNNGKFYGMDPQVFRELVNAHGMDFLSSHVMLPIEGMDEGEIMQWWQTCIDAHQKAGVKYLVQAAMGGEASQNIEALDRYIEMFNTVGEMAQEAGIKFGFHNHAVEFQTIDGQVIMDRMLQNTNPDYVFFQLDLYWINQGGADPVDYFQKYPGRFALWHVKDQAELGASGQINFERIFNAADQSGMEYLVVEVENYNYNPLESVRISLDYLIDADFVQ
ncbi:MAG: sugar phosphate isomerase/epimerase family protein [Bacteroidota bacterium]